MRDESTPDAEPAPTEAGPTTAGRDSDPRRRRTKWIVAFVVVDAVFIAVVLAIVLGSLRGAPAGPDSVIYREGHNPFLEAEGPTCIGMPLGNDTVVYSIDASSALYGVFDAIRSAVGRSLGTLGARQRFGMVVWQEGSPKVLAPASNTPAARDAATDLLDEVQPTGTTDAAAGIRQAIKLNPEALCIIAAKGPVEKDVSRLAEEIRRAGIVLRCLVIRDEAPTLASLAERVDGSYQVIDAQDLKIWLSESQ